MTIEIVEADLASREHAGALVRLLNEYALDPMGRGSELSDEVKANLAAELHGRDSAHVILAYVDGAPGGLMGWLEGFSPFGCKTLLYIHHVLVTTAHQAKRLSELMLHMADPISRLLSCF